MTLLILQLLLAHILGDFLFQPARWVAQKQAGMHRSKYLYWHIGVHALTLLLALRFDLQYWAGILFILISHYLIDLIRLKLTGRVGDRLLFFADQALHLLAITLVVYWYEPFQPDFSMMYSGKVLLLLISVLLLTQVASVVMKTLVTKWDFVEDEAGNSLDKAGKYIGMLERLFVFGFIVFQQWQAIGFLLAAKSVFRFGDLTKAKDRKLTEYILIGTLLSFGMAIIIGLGYVHFVGKIAG
ncbi:MAG: DUF3307 domain-containing protein [Cyclobacteriaceae bacterium]|nr:DUF3307 domain-containing protein [Cyclobacteriaceae bacterium]